ncbi:MAG: capsule-associated protein CAP1 [Stictis urceolatum]|nr:capsule-associated protein CAP1 [Stictis urceolata]
MRSRQLVSLMLLGIFVVISIYLMRNPQIEDFQAPFRAPTKEKEASKLAEPAKQPSAEKLNDTPAKKPAEQIVKEPAGKPVPPAQGSTQETTAVAPPQKKPSPQAETEHAAEEKEKAADDGQKAPAQDTKAKIESTSHPIDTLVGKAGRDFGALLEKQSKTLKEAVAEYKRRYKIHPPPNFDRWYEFASSKGVQLIDEYDTIYDSLLPFWGLEPATIRARVKESIGFDNAMMAISIRDGKIVKIMDASEWQQKATKGMMADFVQYLPDMDLAFNIHDEPRVVIPNDDLSRLVNRALNDILPTSFKTVSPRKKFSKPTDIGDGETFEEYRFTRFNVFAHQPTWSHSRQSCPPTSPARSLDESTPDSTDVWSTPDGLFIQNKTAFSDICNTPSLRETFGFFDRPNALKIVQDLFPVFSQSKVSSYQDILYPSPWYWANKVPYHGYQDYAWDKKYDKLYWRGSTTGGFSRNGGWRRQHRQQVVGHVNRADNATILEQTTAGDKTEWVPKTVDKAEYKDLMDVYFSGVGQCDPGDCDAQKEYFEIADSKKQHEAWNYKYLLDMDGNAFSGRWYAFLNSRSMPFKMAYFREWHEEWIKPWVHYVPLSLSGSEYFETLRYFDREDKGKMQALEVAEAGRQWAQKALRNGDLEVWFFRLLLEYGRLVDDDRHLLGYSEGSEEADDGGGSGQ